MPMDSAVAGLIGAGIGAVAGMTGTLLSQLLQSRRENKKWLITRKEDAYSNTLRYLLKVLNRRSKITAKGVAVLSQEDMPDWFTDLSEAQSWITSLTIYCSHDVRKTIKLIAGKYNSAMSTLMGYNVLLLTEHPKEVESKRVIIDHGLVSLTITHDYNRGAEKW